MSRPATGPGAESPAHRNAGACTTVSDAAAVARATLLAETLTARAGITGEDPGIAIGFFSGGALVADVCRGLASVADAEPLTRNTVLDLGSVGKQLWAAAFLSLSARGEIGLDDDIRELFPELAIEHEVSWSQCLRHTSGLRDYLVAAYSLGLDWEALATQDAVVASIARQHRPEFTPGTRMQYCNSGFVLVASALGRIAGTSPYAVLRDRLLDPLGMERSCARGADPERETALAPSYAGGPGSWGAEEAYETVLGDGGILAPLAELGPWLGFLEGGTGVVGGTGLSAEVRAELISPTVLPSGPVPYGAGIMLGTDRGARTLGHGGRMYGYRSYVLSNPDAGWSVALLANRPDLPLSSWAPELLAALTGTGDPDPAAAAPAPATAAPTPTTTNPAPAAASAAAAASAPALPSAPAPDTRPEGVFLAGERLAVVELTPVGDDGLRIDRHAGEGAALLPRSNENLWGDESAGILRSPNGGLVLLDWRAAPQPLLPADPPGKRGQHGQHDQRSQDTQRGQSSPAPGDYRDPETGARLTVTASGELLLPGHPAAPIVEICDGVFGASGLTLAPSGSGLLVRLRTGSELAFAREHPAAPACGERDATG